MLRNLSLSLGLFLAGLATAVGTTVPAVFSDHLVLQAGQPVPVWGWGEPGEKVSVIFGGQNKSGVAGKDGRWEVQLDPLAVSARPAELHIVGAQEINVKDILVGEVWLCSGQSNMEKPLGEQRGQKPTLNFEDDLREANYPEIRLLKVGRARTPTPARDIQGTWIVCQPVAIDRAKFSAVGYFFGRRLFKELHVPIGMIDSSFGGSSIEPWIIPAALASVPALAELLRPTQLPKGTIVTHQGVKEIPLEIGPMYRGMIAPLVPFALRGILWYQGESNIYAGDETIYTDKMTALVNGWRAAWNRELPFYYVQVAPLLYHVTRNNLVVSPEAEPRFWEAQAACLRLPRTGMVVTTDLVDDLTDIHPRDKKSVGERLARWALNREYGRSEIEPSGPIYRNMERRGPAIRVNFDHASAGLNSRNNKPLDWFVIAGADSQFFPAQADIETDHVLVHSPLVPHPTAVRFGWDEAARPNLYNAAGLPAMPFRTDGPETAARH